MYCFFILRFCFSHLTQLFFICLFCMFFVFFYLSIFFLCRSLGFPSHPKTKKKNNPKSKLQNPDQEASKRVCPTRVSAHPSAQQLRPQRLNRLNPLLPFILMKKLGSLPHILFLWSKLRCFTWNFGSWPVSPKNHDNHLLQVHQQDSEQNVKLEITKKFAKLCS